MAILGALVGGALGLLGSKKSADATEAAANTSVGLQRRIYNESVNRMAPNVHAGRRGLDALQYEMGLTDTAPDGYTGISMSPAAQFQLTQGRDMVEAGAAGRGGLFSGSTAKALEDYRSGVALADRDNQLNRLFGIAQMGQSAAAGQGAAGSTFAANAGNTIMQAGQAKAAGIVGGVNAVNSTIDNLYGYQAMNRMMQQ